MSSLQEASRSKIGWFARSIEPLTSGLPNWRVVTWFPALVALGAVVLIVLNISGSSSGAHWAYFGMGQDPNLLIGNPRLIRSDEWFVHQAWVISQIQQGFPSVNQTLPGGMDVTVALEVPVLDWSALFRPHTWGYFLLGADGGLAWEWWIPAIALVSGAYLLTVTYLPTKPITAALIACGLYFTPIFQWWYGTSSLYPAAWAMLAIAAVRWILRDDRLWVRVVWSAVVGWLAVTMVMGLYAPFIIPVLIVFLFCFIGSVLNERPFTRASLGAVAKRVAPLIVAGTAAVVVFVVWISARLATVDALSSTVYPGQRLRLTGQMLERDPFGTWFAGAVWGQSFHYAEGATALGPNASESSTVILLALFLVPGLVYFLVKKLRANRTIDWLIVSILFVDLLLLAYLFIPGWDAVAHLLFLDRVPLQRIWIAFAVLLPLTFVVIVREVERAPSRPSIWLPVGTAAGVVVLHGLLLWRIVSVSPEIMEISPLWPVALVGVVAACVLVYVRKAAHFAALALLVSSLVIAANVNPLYVGAFDLRQTATGKAVAELEQTESGTWLGVGSQEVMALLMESGVEAYNGVQIYPPEELWDEVDPSGTYENEWNRLGHIQWAFGRGEPRLTSPQVDVVRGTFDACSSFAQKNVHYVITDQPAPTSDCLAPVKTIHEAHLTFEIFAVVSDQSN
jgi:hypothetical protein